MPQRKVAGEPDDGTGSDDHGRSSGSDCTPHKVLDLSHSDKDNVFFCSYDDSGVEMDPGTSGEESKVLAAGTRIVAWGMFTWTDGSDESEPPNTRAAMRTHTSWQNDCVLTDTNIPT